MTLNLSPFTPRMLVSGDQLEEGSSGVRSSRKPLALVGHATIELAHRSSAQGVRLVIVCGPPSVHRVFTITGLTERLPFVDQPPISQSSGRRIRAWTVRSGTSYSAVRRVHAEARIPGS